jgi:hypothetical protein
VLEQIKQDFPADDIKVDGFYLYVGANYRSFINIDAYELYHSRAASNRGRNYVVFLATYLYNRFRLVPAKDSLSYQLITEIEIAKLRSLHERMQRFGHGIGYFEYWDGTQWRVKAVPFTDMDHEIRIPLPGPDVTRHGSGAYDPATGSPYEEKLEELEAVLDELPPPQLTAPPAGDP